MLPTIGIGHLQVVLWIAVILDVPLVKPPDILVTVAIRPVSLDEFEIL
jgi:hypothetical protein